MNENGRLALSICVTFLFLTLPFLLTIQTKKGNEKMNNTKSTDVTMQNLLEKWTGKIASGVKLVLSKYYMRTENIDAGQKDFVKTMFSELKSEIIHLAPVLEDMTPQEIYGMEDIFILVYGITSDEVYAIRRFFDLLKRMDEWDEDYMWNDCAGDKRLLSILTQ